MTRNISNDIVPNFGQIIWKKLFVGRLAGTRTDFNI